jgi:hypothetical protein
MSNESERERIRQWRLRAEECRTIGDQMCDPSTRESFRRMGSSYDRLADAWERRSDQNAPPKEPKAG